MTIKYVAVIQCQKAQNRCCGFHCANSFFSRTDHFAEYDETVKFIPFTCGGCNGKGVNAKVANLAKASMRKASLSPDDFVIHFASCITNDNRHSERCIFLESMKRHVNKIGFKNIRYGSYISKTAQRKREEGIYKTYS